MFGREFQAGEHRQHIVPSPPTGYGFEVIGSRKEARPSERDLLSIVKSIAVSVGFPNARSMKNYDGSYFASLGRDYELFITPTGRDSGYDWSVERKGSGVVREGYGMTSREIIEDIRGSGVVASRTAGKCPKCDGMGRETYETDTGSLSTQTCTACGGTGQAKEAARTASWDQEYDGTWFGSFPNGVLGWLIPSRDSELPDTYTVSAEVDRPGDSRELFTEFNVSLEEGKRMVEEAAAQVTAARKTAAVTWYDQSDQFGGMWSTYQGSAPDSPNGQISESNGTYRWYVSDSGTRGNQQTGESSSLEEAKREAESALASLGITASRRTAKAYFGKPSSSSQAHLLRKYSKPSKLRGMTFEDLDGLEEFVKAQLEACPMDSIEVDDVLRGIKAARKWKEKNGYTANRRTAFLDTIDLPEPRHRVAGWDWDDHLNGFLAAEAAREFTCSCGASVPAPGYTDCRCGKRWNVYSVLSEGRRKLISREVPVRENVIMARTASSRKTASPATMSDADLDLEYQKIRRQLNKGDDTNFDRGLELRQELKSRGLPTNLKPPHIMRQEYGDKYDMFATRKQAADYSDYSYDQLVDERDILRQQYADWKIDQSEYKDTLAEIEAEAESRGLTLASRKGRVVARRTTSTAAPSSGADAIAQHFPGWIVDDDDGNFWEVQSPGREHAFIHEEDGTYTLLMNDNTPDEFYATGLSFEDALAEVRAEGII